jgi:hypothetical protein
MVVALLAGARVYKAAFFFYSFFFYITTPSQDSKTLIL